MSRISLWALKSALIDLPSQALFVDRYLDCDVRILKPWITSWVWSYRALVASVLIYTFYGAKELKEAGD
jgi:hypothetical protein